METCALGTQNALFHYFLLDTGSELNVHSFMYGQLKSCARGYKHFSQENNNVFYYFDPIHAASYITQKNKS